MVKRRNPVVPAVGNVSTLLFLLSATPVDLIIKAAGSVRSENPVDLSKQAEISGWGDLYDGCSRALKIVAGVKVANEYGALVQPSNRPRNCESSKPRFRFKFWQSMRSVRIRSNQDPFDGGSKNVAYL